MLIRSKRLLLIVLVVITGSVHAKGLTSVGLTSVGLTSAQVEPEVASGRTSKSLVSASKHMVVTANPHSSRIARDILRAGGSAVDAAIAAQMVLNVVEPQSSGIGGGAFMLAYDAASGKITVYDGRETTPAAATEKRFLTTKGKRLGFFDAVDSGLSVGVPGVVRLSELAHQEHGKLPWAQLFAPASRLAEQGFAVSARLHRSVESARKRLALNPQSRAYFLTESLAAKPVGSVLKNPELAQVFEEIAQRGADAFYQGITAEQIVAKLATHARRPGVMSLADLSSYRAIRREALCHGYRGLKVCGMPPPSSGALTVLQTLSILEGFDLSALGAGSVEAVHLVSEAYRLAYADRAKYIADPSFVTVPISGLLSASYNDQRRQRINSQQSMGKPVAGVPAGAPIAGTDRGRSLPSTTHISIVDAAGNAVSMTSSIEHAFGSAQMVRGFLLNNQLTDFSFRANDKAGRPIANRVQAGKRPRSSMAPTMIFDAANRLEAVLGSPGGSSIIQYVTHTILGLVDWRHDVQRAIDSPHYGAKTGAMTTLEKGSAVANLAAALAAKGHKTRLRAQTSGIHAIVFNGRRADGQRGQLAQQNIAPEQRWMGGADSRREGLVLGD